MSEQDRPEVQQDVQDAWSALVATALRSVEDGLVVGTSGNVSVRVGDLVLVTPTGVPYDRIGPDDIVAVDLDGKQVMGTLRPSSELPMHLAIYLHTDARAVVHTHAVHATAVSTLLYELPAIHYMAAALGGKIRVADYATYGSEQLAANVLHALRERTGCLIRNHGTIVYGDDLDQAYDRTAQLEWMCQVWLAARSVDGFSPPCSPSANWPAWRRNSATTASPVRARPSAEDRPGGPPQRTGQGRRPLAGAAPPPDTGGDAPANRGRHGRHDSDRCRCGRRRGRPVRIRLRPQALPERRAARTPADRALRGRHPCHPHPHPRLLPPRRLRPVR